MSNSLSRRGNSAATQRQRAQRRPANRNRPNSRFDFSQFQVVFFPSPAPRHCYTTLRWSLALNLSITGSPWVNDTQVALNDIFSPNATHQPLGHDQWATFYNRYVVIGADVMVSFSNTTAQNVTVSSNHVAIVATNSGTGILSPSTAMEQYRGTWLVETGSPGAPPVKFMRRYNLRDIYGVSDQTILTDDRFQAQFGATPTEICRLHVVSSKDGATAYAAAVTFNVLYHVIMFDANQLLES
jgi:hypothetical protein